MLNFWNITGVPFLYCFQSLYILKNQSEIEISLPLPYIICTYIILITGYYIFDSANCQKASCKIKHLHKRNTFPKVPWAVIENPKFLKTPKGI